jgi:hypothetical protein
MAHEPSQRPFPKATGGLAGATYGRPMRVPGTLRPPDLGQPPAVVSISGFGSPAGAFIRNEGSAADQAQGIVVVRAGVIPAGSGTIALTFPAGIAANQYMFLADWATFAVAVAGAQATLTWTAARAILANERLHLAYQWSQSS